jgi:undecaprenyl-diphosphatase
MSSRNKGQALRSSQALALGALHGPAELLPVSSSAHVSLLPWLLDWDYELLDQELRKTFEVALHAGTAAALLITLREEGLETLRELSPRLIGLTVLTFTPSAVIGYALERPVERYLGDPLTIAVALTAGAVAMARADRMPQRRHTQDAGAGDAFWIGIAQACALVPGVSRNGATLAAARARRFTRQDANRLSRHAAVPVIAGATFLKTVRARRRGLPREVRLPFALGAAASFVSTLAFTWLIHQVERDRSLRPYAAYRIALAVVVFRRLARKRSGRI